MDKKNRGPIEIVGLANLTAKPKTESKVKFSCQQCESNAWAKPGTNLICGDCKLKMDAAEPPPKL